MPRQHLSTCSCSRRSFLKGSGITLAGFGITSLFPTPFVQHAMAQTVGSKRMLFIFLRGGNDGINAVIPHGDPDYNSTNRPTLHIPAIDAIDLNGFASLNPALEDILDTGQQVHPDLAIIHRVGYQNNSRSHFDGQRIWENGDPSQPQLFEGWLYRYIAEHSVSQGVNLPVLTSQSVPPLLIRGSEKFVNVANPDGFDYIDPDPKRSKYSDAWRELYTDLVGLEPYRPVLSQTGLRLIDTLDEYRSWDQVNWDPKDPNSGNSLFPVSDQTNPDDPSGPNGKKFSTESYDFFRSVKVSALSLLESDGVNNNGTRIAGTQLNGFDLHSGQGQLNGRHSELLGWLGYALASLRTVLSGAATDPRGYSSIWTDTVVCTLSEFGRTTKENGSVGTDHAAASCMMLQGGSVSGGVYNITDSSDWPSGVMFGVDGRYLQERTDYRAICWEILRDHMGADPAHLETIFPGYNAAGLPAQELGVVI